MMMMKSVLWWRKPEYPEETTDLRQVTDETFYTFAPELSVHQRVKVTLSCHIKVSLTCQTISSATWYQVGWLASGMEIHGGGR